MTARMVRCRVVRPSGLPGPSGNSGTAPGTLAFGGRPLRRGAGTSATVLPTGAGSDGAPFEAMFGDAGFVVAVSGSGVRGGFGTMLMPPLVVSTHRTARLLT